MPHTHRRPLSLALALFLLLAVCAPVRGQQTQPPTNPPNWHVVTGAQQRFLQGFVTSFPQLRTRWVGTNYCAWEGVFCFYGNISVWLHDRGLIGKLPEWTQADTAGADVAQIHLSGNPGVSGTLPVSWRFLKYATSIDLNQTSVTGTIPSSWTELSELQAASFSKTRICGGMPKWTNAKLKYFAIGDNKMKGRLEGSFASMPALETVVLGGNDFCQCVPSSWAAVPALNATIASLPVRVTSPRCMVVNKCGQQTEACVPRRHDGGEGPLSATLLASALASIAVALFAR